MAFLYETSLVALEDMEFTYNLMMYDLVALDFGYYFRGNLFYEFCLMLV